MPTGNSGSRVKQTPEMTKTMGKGMRNAFAKRDDTTDTVINSTIPKIDDMKMSGTFILTGRLIRCAKPMN